MFTDRTFGSPCSSERSKTFLEKVSSIRSFKNPKVMWVSFQQPQSGAVFLNKPYQFYIIRNKDKRENQDNKFHARFEIYHNNVILEFLPEVTLWNSKDKHKLVWHYLRKNSFTFHMKLIQFLLLIGFSQLLAFRMLFFFIILVIIPMCIAGEIRKT